MTTNTAEILDQLEKEYPGIAKRMNWALPEFFRTAKIPASRSPGKYTLMVFPTPNILSREFSSEDLTGLGSVLSDPSIIRIVIEIGNITELEDKAKGIINRLNESSDLPKRDIIISREMNRIKELTSYYALHQWVFHEKLVEKILSGRFEEITPVTAEFVPTLNCTFRCKLCSYEVQKQAFDVWEDNDVNNPKAHMDWDTMKLATRKLHDIGVKGVIYTGGGEPTFCKDLIRGMRLARELGMDIGLFTNGSVLTEDKIKELMSLEPVFVRLSLNSGTEATHREYHVYKEKDAKYFQHALKTIESIAHEKVKRNSPTSFGLAFLTHESNMNELHETAERIIEIVRRTSGGIDFVVFRPAVDYYHGSSIDQDFLMKTEKVLNNTVKPMMEEAGIKFDYLGRRAKDMISGKSYNTCISHGAFAEVGPDGSMYLCCEKNIMPQFCIGDLKCNSAQEIWQGKARSDLSAWVNKKNLKVCPTVCKPHELNKLFHKITELLQAGQREIVEKWIRDLREMPKPINVNFI